MVCLLHIILLLSKLWCRDLLDIGKVLLLHDFHNKETLQVNSEMDNALECICCKGPSSVLENAEVNGGASVNSSHEMDVLI